MYMKKVLIITLAILILTGCGHQSVFGVSTNDDNSISIIGDHGAKGSMGIGYLTVAESEQVVIDAIGLNKDGTIICRFMHGVIGSDDFSDELTCETTVSGGESASITIEAGEYSVGVVADSSITGNARIFTESVDEMALLGYTPDSLVGTWSEKSAGRGNIDIKKVSADRYTVQVNWSSSADEMYVWKMTASPAGSNVLHYTDCIHSIIVFSEDGSDAETPVYENGTGEFTLLSTNELMWQDDIDQAGQDTLFVSEG